MLPDVFFVDIKLPEIMGVQDACVSGQTAHIIETAGHNGYKFPHRRIAFLLHIDNLSAVIPDDFVIIIRMLRIVAAHSKKG